MIVRGALLAAALLAAPVAASAASFDCAKAGTPVEHMICADPGVSALDQRLAEAYKSASARDPHVKETQREWLATSRNKCGTTACLSEAYGARLDALKKDGPACAASTAQLVGRYRASAGIRAINELKPILGLELTATPFVESARGAVAFKNVIYDYPLAKAMADGFVKEPAVVTRKTFNPAGMSPDEIERLKLEDGVRLHESVKVELETYARESENPIVKPFVLVIARDTTHASQLLALIQSDAFFEGRYRDKVIQVDSSRTGADEEKMIQDLLAIEHASNATEIVIHVNMLKEGWDVTNLYTIVPLRAANARTLIEQSIGRGLRLPYGKRTGVTAVDRLNTTRAA